MKTYYIEMNWFGIMIYAHTIYPASCNETKLFYNKYENVWWGYATAKNLQDGSKKMYERLLECLENNN